VAVVLEPKKKSFDRDEDPERGSTTMPGQERGSTVKKKKNKRFCRSKQEGEGKPPPSMSPGKGRTISLKKKEERILTANKKGTIEAHGPGGLRRRTARNNLLPMARKRPLSRGRKEWVDARGKKQKCASITSSRILHPGRGTPRTPRHQSPGFLL